MPGLPPNFSLPHSPTAHTTAHATDVLGNDQDIRDALNLATFGQGTLAARPAPDAVKAGYIYLATDDWGGTAYITNGTTWTKIASKDRKILTPGGGGGVLDFTGLDGNSELGYDLQWAFHSGAPGGPFWLRFNDDAGNDYTPDVVTDGSNHAMLLSAGGIGPSRQVGRALITPGVSGGTDRVVSIESATFTDAGVGSTDTAVGTWSNTGSNIVKISVSNEFNAVTGIIVLRRLA